MNHLEVREKIKPFIGGVNVFQNLLKEKYVTAMPSQIYISQNSFISYYFSALARIQLQVTFFKNHLK